MPEDITAFNLTGIPTADKETLTISSGDITPTKQFVIVAAQTGTADFLDGIITSGILSPGDADGAVIYLMAAAGDTITIRHNQNAAATKNVLTSTGRDVVMQPNELFTAVHDISLDTNGAWVVNEPERFADAYNGTFLESFTFVVTEAAGVITGTLDKNPSGDLTERFSDGYSTASSGISIALTAGADDAPVLNYVYILQSNKGVLAKSTSGWPAAEHNKVAEVILQTAAKTQSEGGALVNRFWNDFTKGTDGQGHHTHAWERLRHEHSAWLSGGAITWTIDSVPNPDTVNLAVTAAKVYQLHLQDFEAKDTAGGDNVHVVNDSGTPYTEITDFNALLTDNAGGSMSGRYFTLVVWGSISSGSEIEHLFVNLPGGSYNRQADAIADVSGFTVYDIPPAFRGKAFLITRITLRHQAAASGTWTSIRETDLRGQVPNIVAGGGTAAITTEFADTQFRVFDDGTPTKELAFQVSGVSASTTRTLTVPNASGIIALTSQSDGTIDHDADLVAGTIAAHDTGATGAELDTLTDGSNADALHVHAAAGVGHAILDGSIHTDSVADAVTAGSIVIGNDTPKWDELVISVPNAGARNVLAIDNGETVPSWKGIDLLVDADGDTKIQVEESADEDMIRFDVGGKEIVTIDAISNIDFFRDDATAGNAPTLKFKRSRAGGAVSSGDALLVVRANPHDGGGFDGGADIIVLATENHTATNHGQKMEFRTVPDGSTSRTLAVTIEQDQVVTVEQSIAVDTISEKTGAAGVTIDGVVLKDSLIAETYLPNASKTAQGVVELATTAEINTGTDTGRAMPVDQFVASNRNIRFITIRLVQSDTDVVVGAIGGDWVCPFTGTLLQDDAAKNLLSAYNDVAGTTGTMVVDIHKGGATIMDTNKLDIETTEKNTTEATTQPDLSTTAVTAGDIFTFEVDAVHTTEAKGLTVTMAIRMT